MMTGHFSPHLFRAALWAVCLTLPVADFFVNASFVSASDYMGPVFPADTIVDMESDDPPPLPKPNSLLQRPKNNKSKQVVFDDLDPVGSVIPQKFLQDENINAQEAQIIRQKRVPAAMSKVPTSFSLPENNVLFMESGETVSEGIVSVSPSGTSSMESYEMGEFMSSPFPLTFGMGVFDNLTFFGETTTFKSELSDGSGSFGIGEGLNWSIPITAQGGISAQYGLRTVQGDLFTPVIRNQIFMTAGVFKRFDNAPVQGGVAVDWLEDNSPYGLFKLRQMRAEVSARSFRNFEYGFIGGFNVFRDHPTTWDIDRMAIYFWGQNYEGEVVVQDYYLLFARKHLNCGGQVELRGGATSRGDIMLSTFGEVAINDRLAVNGGVSMLCPAEGRSDLGGYRESWMMSLGIVLYFRGGATNKQNNLYRPMFDVAGNNTFFPKIIGKYVPPVHYP